MSDPRVLVPVGVLAGASGVVAFASILLLAALALCAAATSGPGVRRDRDHRPSLYAYRTIVAVLSGSALVGSDLAEALPWQ